MLKGLHRHQLMHICAPHGSAHCFKSFGRMSQKISPVYWTATSVDQVYTYTRIYIQKRVCMCLMILICYSYLFVSSHIVGWAFGWVDLMHACPLPLGSPMMGCTHLTCCAVFNAPQQEPESHTVINYEQHNKRHQKEQEEKGDGEKNIEECRACMACGGAAWGGASWDRGEMICLWWQGLSSVYIIILIIIVHVIVILIYIYIHTHPFLIYMYSQLLQNIYDNWNQIFHIFLSPFILLCFLLSFSFCYLILVCFVVCI